MPTSIREQLLAAITLAVGGVYDTEIPTDERELPITLVFDEPETATDDYDNSNVVLPVSIASVAEAASRDQTTQRAQANDLLAIIIATVITNENFGGLAQAASYEGGGILLNNKFVAAEAQFLITYSFLRNDPYSQS